MNIITKDYILVFEDIKKQIREAQYQSFKEVNKQMIHMYWQIGKILSEQTKLGWGKSIIAYFH